MLYLADNALYHDNHRLDPHTLTWTDVDSIPDLRTPIRETEAIRWLREHCATPVRPPVAVIGPREATEEELEVACELGRFLARLGLTVLCGGRQGVMEAVCRGVAEGGGLSVGLLPQGDWQSGNRFVTVPVATGIGIARNALIARAALCVVAVGGGLGTISEIALSLQFGKRVFGLCRAPEVPGIEQCDSLTALQLPLCRAVLGLS